MKQATTLVAMLLAVLLTLSGLVVAEAGLGDSSKPVSDTNVTDTDVVEVLGVGDVDGREGVNAGDALIILKVAVGKLQATEEQLPYLDTYRDGSVNAVDALMVLQYAVHLRDELPVIPAVVTPGDVTPTEG